jgi:hypothetical protein
MNDTDRGIITGGGRVRWTVWRGLNLMRLQLNPVIKRSTEAPVDITDTIVRIEVGIAHIEDRVTARITLTYIEIDPMEMTDVRSNQRRARITTSIHVRND